MTAEDRVRELGLNLAVAPAPSANYVPWVQTGNLLFLAGLLPSNPDGSRLRGKLGADMNTQTGYAAARLAAIGQLARLRAAAGSLDRITRIVKVNGFVNSTPDFEEQPLVVNGASDLFVEVFGDAGRHARTAVSAGALPLGGCVEIELIAEVRS